jgi:hypothetical protein
VPQVITCICSIPTVRSSGQCKIDEVQNRLRVRSWWLTHVREAYLRIGPYENHDSFKDAAQVSKLQGEVFQLQFSTSLRPARTMIASRRSK